MERARSRNDEKLAVLRNEYETANRKLQAQLDRASGVHQLRVEKEFKALSGIWEKVVETGRVMAGLRPFLDIASDEEDAPEDAPARLRRRFPPFVKAVSDSPHRCS